MRLDDLVRRSAAERPDAPAVRDGSSELSYRELDTLSNQLARTMVDVGVRPGDRVGLWLDKSCFAVAATQGVLRAGAAYVPIDPLMPPTRAAAIASDCAIRALVTSDEARARALSGDVAVITRESVDATSGAPLDLPRAADDLAYILYTSGSTGTPKGVCIRDRNALAFIRWADETLETSPEDRFSNHAPLHFDLSVLDLYVAFAAGASVTLIPDEMAYSPRQLVAFLRRERPTIWYSVPSALIMMMDHGGLEALTEHESLRAVLFAGEPFPIAHLRRLRRLWPAKRFLNLYGPTETNVCTYHEVEGDLEGRERPIPIGRQCSNDRVWAVKDDGTIARPDEEGELVAEGDTVMLGYWGQPPQVGPYRTGDIVRVLPDGVYEYVGRRDQMVKLRGHRVELGEIETVLSQIEGVREAAAAVVGSGIDAQLFGVLVLAEGAPPPHLLRVKRACADRLPRYMIVDRIRISNELPRTRNGKVDRRALESILR